MKKKNKVWTLISPTCHEILFKIAEEKKIPATKIVLNTVFNKLPDKLEDDYLFVTEGARKIVITLNDKEYERITELVQKENVKPSKFLRMVIYTYLKQGGYIE